MILWYGVILNKIWKIQNNFVYLYKFVFFRCSYGYGEALRFPLFFNGFPEIVVFIFGSLENYSYICINYLKLKTLNHKRFESLQAEHEGCVIRV